MARVIMKTKKQTTKPASKGNAMLIRPEDQQVIAEIRERENLHGIADPQIIRLVLERYRKQLAIAAN